MVSLIRSNTVTALAMFVLLTACSICSGVSSTSGASILQDGARNATYPCLGIGDECLSIVEELEYMDVEFSHYYFSSSIRRLENPPPHGGGSHSGFTPHPGQTPACGGKTGLAYQCCMAGKQVDSNFQKCV